MPFAEVNAEARRRLLLLAEAPRREAPGGAAPGGAFPR
jgi:hypothetical protein